MLPAIASAALYSTAAKASFTDDNELILEIQTARRELSDTIVGYSWRGGIYLPLGEVARFLDLPIAISDDGHFASGWALEAKHTVAINLRSGKLTVEGRETTLGAMEARAFNGELYLRAEQFSELFPLTLEVSMRAQMVTVKTRVPFPFEQRIQREDLRERLGNRPGVPGDRHWPREATPWKALSFPIGETELRIASDSQKGTRAEGDLRLSGDLAFLTTRLFLSDSSRDGLTSASLEMGRRDPGKGLLGPLKASEFEVGDVATVPLTMGLAATSGRGIFVSNALLQRASVFDTIELRGDLPDGYEVELYRNDLLIDSTRVPVNGQYQFLHVPVEFGLNLFRLAFYGPQGQRREVTRQISVGDGRLSKGEFVYSFGAVQKNVNLINVHLPDFLPGLDYGAWRSSGQLQYGVSSNLTASLGGAYYQSGGNWHWLATGGLRTGIGGYAIKADVGVQDHGGKAFELGIAGKLAGFSVTLSHAEYRGQFIDEVRSLGSDVLRRATELTVNGALRLGGGEHPLTIPIYGFARQIAFGDGRVQQTLALHQSIPVAKGLMLANLFDFSRSAGTDGISNTRLSGSFDLMTLSGSRMQYRASVEYGIAPRPELTAATLEANRRIGDDSMIRASIGRNFAAGQMQLGLSAIRRFGHFSLAFDGNYLTNPNQYSATLRLGLSFGRNPLSGAFFLAPPGLSADGAVAIQAYRDLNGNAKYDKDDPPVPDAEFFTGTEHAKSDARGIAFLGRLGNGALTSYQVDTDTLPDIAYAPVTKGVEFVPRAGRIHTSAFAIVALAEVDGTAYFRSGSDRPRPVSGLNLQLRDAQDKVVARARSYSDGSFTFEQVRPGTYSIRIEPSQAANLKIQLESAPSVTTNREGGLIRQDITVINDRPD